MIGSVEIAGGGIAGLTAGLAFARKGWRVRVHEQDEDLRILGAGIYIWENGLRVLDALGVLHDVIADTLPAWRHEKRDQDGKVIACSRLAPDFRLYVPLRERLLVALYEALIEAGGAVVFKSRAVAADPKGCLQFADGSSTSADLVVAADGVHSPIRDGLGLLRSRNAVNQFGYRAMIRRESNELPSEVSRAHCENWSGSRRLLYAPCTEELAYVQLTSVKGDGAANRVPIDRDVWHSSFPRLGWIIDRIPDQGRGDWFELVRTTNWAKGRVALVGDSATGQPPFLGQGGGCAMMSGFTLAEAVNRAGDVIAGIADWQYRERGFAEWVQRVAYWYGQLALLPAPARTAVLRSVSRRAWLRDATLLVAARYDPTAPEHWRELDYLDQAVMFPLIH